MNFNNFAKEGWGWFEHFFWVGACWGGGGVGGGGGGLGGGGGGGSGILEKAIRSFTSNSYLIYYLHTSFFLRMFLGHFVLLKVFLNSVLFH